MCNGNHRLHRVSVEDPLLLVQSTPIVAEEIRPSLGGHREHSIGASIPIEDGVGATFVLAQQIGSLGVEAVDVRVVVLISAEEILAIFRETDRRDCAGVPS